MEHDMNTDRLREVFELCDEDNIGHVYADRIIELARQANTGDSIEAIKHLENVLSVWGDNPITFDQFCNAVKSIDNDDGVDTDNLVRRMSITYQNMTTDDEGLKFSMDDSSTTFNEYDFSTMIDDDNRESVLSNPINGSFDNSLRELHPNDYNKFSSRLQNEVIYELEDKVNILRTQISNISQEKTSQFDRLLRLQNENNELRNRILVMEERLQDVEMLANNPSSNSTYVDNKYLMDETMAKYARLLSEEKEVLLQRICNVETDLSRTKEENQELKGSITILTNRIENLREQQPDHDETYDTLRKDHDSILQLYNNQVEQLEESKEKIQNLRMASQNDLNGHSPSSDDYYSQHEGNSSFANILRDLQDNLTNVNEENAKLKEENAELCQRIELQTLKEKMMFDETPWATELDMMSKEELQTKIQDLLSENIRYRNYVESINTKILQKYPELLEKSPLNR